MTQAGGVSCWAHQRKSDSGLHASDADPTCALGSSSGMQAGTPSWSCQRYKYNGRDGISLQLHLQMKEGNRQEASHLRACRLIVVKGRLRRSQARLAVYGSDGLHWATHRNQIFCPCALIYFRVEGAELSHVGSFDSETPDSGTSVDTILLAVGLAVIIDRAVLLRGGEPTSEVS
jgi:hypothetical protein